MKYSLPMLSLAFIFSTGCGHEEIESRQTLSEADWQLASQPSSPLDLDRLIADDRGGVLNTDIAPELTDPQHVIPRSPAATIDSGIQTTLLDELDNDDGSVVRADLRFIELVPENSENSVKPALTESNSGFGAEADCLALAFGGRTKGIIENSTGMNLSFAKGTTIEGWVRIDDQSGTIIAKRGHEVDPSWALDYEDGELLFSVGTDASHRSVYAAEFPTSEWFHFAIIRGPEVDGGVAIFIDGSDETQQVEHGGELFDIINDQPVVIGFDPTGEHDVFNGAISSLHLSRGIAYSGAFEPLNHLEGSDLTLGLWDFTHVSSDAIHNLEATDHNVRLTGPVYGEHSGLCN